MQKIIYQVLESYNPWWKGKKIAVKIKREILEGVVKEISSPYIIDIRGTRRAGKTYLFYSIINHLIEKGVSPERIIYFFVEDPEIAELTEKLDFNEFIKDTEAQPKNRFYLFFDEFHKSSSLLPKLRGLWEKASDKVKIFLTGSSQTRVAREVNDVFLGRHRSFRLYPLSFREYLQFNDEEFYKQTLDSISNLSIDKFLENKGIYEILSRRLSPYLDTFFNESGFPEVVLGEEKRQFFHTLEEDYILGNAIKDFRIRNYRFLKAFIRNLARHVNSTVSLNALSQELGVSYTLIEHYLNSLTLSYVIEPVFINPRADYRKLTKIFFVDSGFLRFLGGNEGGCWENFVFLELRKMKKTADICFWRGKGGNEIDFIWNDKLIEAKLGMLIRKGIWYIMDRFGKSTAFILHKKDRIEVRERNGRKVIFLPLSLFLWSKIREKGP